MRMIYIFLMVIVTMFFMTACNKNKTSDNNTEYKKITPKEAYEQILNEDNIIILDVRSLEEANKEKIENSILIPDSEILLTAEKIIPDKNSKIFVYCRSGKRSFLATNNMLKLGYTNVYDLGGIIDWPYNKISE